MKNYKISNEKLYSYNDIEVPYFPKYVTQIINMVAGTAQGTRPKVVGQLSELFPEYVREAKANRESVSIEGWKQWYTKKLPDAIEESTRKINLMMQQYKRAMDSIDTDMIRKWVEDLVFNKTFAGLFFQDVIISYLGDIEHKQSRLAVPEEESKGIDGFVGDKAYSIKPMTYKNESKHLMEIIEAYMVYYEKEKTGLKIEVEDDEDKS